MKEPNSDQRAGRSATTLSFADAAIRLSPSDNVAIAKSDLPAGTIVIGMRTGGEPASDRLTVHSDIPSGHKIATAAIATGETVLRYGQPIGVASQPIAAGAHVHVHNLGLGDAEVTYAFGSAAVRQKYVPEGERRTFQGYRRANGLVGTRNYITIVSTVNCSAHTCRAVAGHFTPDKLAAYPHVDGVVAITHPHGCANGEPGSRSYSYLQRALAGMVAHPNVGASVLIGLGCETNQLGDLVRNEKLDDPSRVPVRPVELVIQDLGGVGPAVAAGIAAVERLLPEVEHARRSEVPISELMVALECGGSDGWSGVTANPLIGSAADELVRNGGTVVLSEVPEIHGAEHLLTRRAVSEETGRKLLAVLDRWTRHLERHGSSFDNNPSPGNKAGGLTNIVEKSLGAIAKAGTTNLVNVYDYAERIADRGLVVMDSPGYDPASVTGKVAGGCTLVLFSTGRGSMFGFKPSPSIKICTNSSTFNRMSGDMDLNAGVLLDGAKDMDTATAELMDLIVSVASGRQTKSEAQGIGDFEFVPWQPDAQV